MNDALIHEIVVRFRGGASMRRIAQSLGISRRTVKRAIEEVEQGRVSVRLRDHPGRRPDAAASSTPT
jgi:DNA-binding transcriptional regulator LsrR (DeoR family)